MPCGLEAVSHIPEYARLDDGSTGCCGVETFATRKGELTGGKLTKVARTFPDQDDGAYLSRGS